MDLTSPPMPKRARRCQNLSVDCRLTKSSSFSVNEDFDTGLAYFKYSEKDENGTPAPKKISALGKNGFRLSDFDLGPEVGRGIGGSVRRAYHRAKGTWFALKEVNVVSSSPRHQMYKELATHAECGDMRNIVRLHDVFYDEGLVYLVLELMSWGSLDALLERQRQAHPPAKLQEREVAYILRECLQALQCLHAEHDTIHRDVKPSNVLLSCEGEVKMSDLGTSRHEELPRQESEKEIIERELEAKETSNNNNFVGTAGYMSPQQINDEEHTCKADIWSLGILALELAAGRHPYLGPEGTNSASGLLDIVQRVLSEPPPTAVGLGMSDAFVDFVSRCLQSSESERLSSRELLNHTFILTNTSADSIEGLKLWLQRFKSEPCDLAE